MSSQSTFRLALIQMLVSPSKSENLKRATQLIAQAAENGATVVPLPEYCNGLCGHDYFMENAEEIPGGESSQAFSRAASENRVHLIAGSIPEIHDQKLYNTCTVYAPDGYMIEKFRKIHLFDVDIPSVSFQESKSISAGNCLAMFDTDLCKIGIGICYDLRFPEMAQIYARNGCKLLVYPGCFTVTTGQAHWELLLRSRAVDNQLYCAGVSSARDVNAPFVAWGHSTIISPWGEVVGTCNEKESIVYADIDLNYLNEVRERIPISTQKRSDLYQVKQIIE